jgi:hypothetical protein
VRPLSSTIALSLLVLLIACSGGGGSGGQTAQTPTPLTITVDRGPEGLTASGQTATNVLYATITVCSPGSTTECQDVDHVQVDTGSTGLRLAYEAMSGVAMPQPVIDPSSRAPLLQCAVFADGFTWGSVVRADVVIAGRRISRLSVEMIGDPAAATAPDACSGGNGPDEGTVASLGSNGILGVGFFLQDCGQYCTTTAPSSGAAPYYVCPGGGGTSVSCTPATVSLADQVSNPLGMLPSENDGLQLQLPAPQAPGAPTVNGTLVFGLGTNDSNPLGPATLLTVDPGDGTLTTTRDGLTFSRSVIDSGSSAYYFPDSTLTACAQGDPGDGFYCPATAVAGNATLFGSNGAQAAVSFTIANADAIFREGSTDTAFPDLGGPLPGSGLTAQTFDWGLPFHFGRTVSILFEQRTLGTTAGPAIGF